MLRKGFLAWAGLLLLPALVSAYTIVLKDGRRLEARSRYVVEAGLVKFVSTEGRTYQFTLAEVDLAATERANAPAETRPRPKLWTNDDLELLVSRSAPVSVVGTAPVGEEAAPSEAEAPGEPAAGEKPTPLPPKEDTAEYWQERLKPLREELAQLEQQIQQLRRGQGQAGSNAVNIMGSNPGVQVEDTLRRLEQRRAQLQQEIEAIQLEAKRKGIPPGYVR